MVNDGNNDTSFLRDIEIIINQSTTQDISNPMLMLLKSLVKDLISGTPIQMAIASIEAANLDSEELINAVKNQPPMVDENMHQLKMIISESAASVRIKSSTMKVAEISNDIINGKIISVNEIKDKYSMLISELFDTMVELKKEVNVSEIEISKDNVENVMNHMDNHLRSSKVVIPTGLTELDKYLDGGLHNSRLYTIVMKSGEGKSTVMLSLSQKIQEVVRQGTDTWKRFTEPYENSSIKYKPMLYYFTFENSVDETLERYLPNGADGHVRDIESFESAKSKMVEKLLSYDVAVKIVYRSSFTTSPLDILRYLESEKIKGNVPVGIFVDYLGLLVSSGGEQEKRLQLEKVTAGLKDLSVHFRAPVITGVQIKKDSYNKPELDESDIKESSGIIDNSDVVIGAWQGNPIGGETFKKELHVKILKQRNFIKDVKFKLAIDFDIFQLVNYNDSYRNNAGAYNQSNGYNQSQNGQSNGYNQGQSNGYNPTGFGNNGYG